LKNQPPKFQQTGETKMFYVAFNNVYSLPEGATVVGKTVYSASGRPLFVLGNNMPVFPTEEEAENFLQASALETQEDALEKAFLRGEEGDVSGRWGVNTAYHLTVAGRY
jgi:hypothetical protein